MAKLLDSRFLERIFCLLEFPPSSDHVVEFSTTAADWVALAGSKSFIVCWRRKRRSEVSEEQRSAECSTGDERRGSLMCLVEEGKG
ncbi:hypothetical protein SLA2020_068280 [Shorea laevis]